MVQILPFNDYYKRLGAFELYEIPISSFDETSEERLQQFVNPFTKAVASFPNVLA